MQSSKNQNSKVLIIVIIKRQRRRKGKVEKMYCPPPSNIVPNHSLNTSTHRHFWSLGYFWEWHTERVNGALGGLGTREHWVHKATVAAAAAGEPPTSPTKQASTHTHARQEWDDKIDRWNWRKIKNVDGALSLSGSGFLRLTRVIHLPSPHSPPFSPAIFPIPTMRPASPTLSSSPFPRHSEKIGRGAWTIIKWILPKLQRRFTSVQHSGLKKHSCQSMKRLYKQKWNFEK